MPIRLTSRSAIPIAMIGAAAVIAQFVGGKATRDALFLARFDITALPVMVMAASLFSIGLAVLMSRAMSRLSPAVFLPAAFAASSALLLVEWGLVAVTPRAAAVLFYLHMLGLGPVLVSGFWSIITERFDPRTAKKRVGQIAGAGTLGGLLGSLAAERVAALVTVSAMLPVLAALNVFCVWAVRRLALSAGVDGRPIGSAAAQALGRDAARSGLHVLARAPYLRNLALLVILSALGAALLDYVFKARAVETLGRGENLLRFFAAYYGVTNLLAFLVQTSLSRLALERLGLALTATMPSFALLAGSAGALAVPGLVATTFSRGSEFVCKTSLFRPGYELFYTPIAASEKRAAKSIIDVGGDRLGDLLGGGLVRLVLFAAATSQYSVILVFAMASSALAFLIARRLNQGYVDTLEKSLLNQAVHIDLSEIEDRTTRTTMLRTLKRPLLDSTVADLSGALRTRSQPAATTPGPLEPIVQQIVVLRSRDRERIRRVLQHDEGIRVELVPHVIPLLAWEPMAPEALHALKKVAEECVGQLTDALIDPNQDFAIRRRLARVFSVCVSQRAADGLLLGLEDRFEVRFQCGRSLASIIDKNPRVRIDRDRILDVVLRELSVSRPVWESHRLLDRLDDRDEVSFVDQFLRDRTNQSLAHLFTLLSLVLHREPLQIAFRGLHTDDQHLRGTALEYLETVLPTPIRERLWPFLEDRRPARRTTRSRDEILSDLLRSNESIVLSLEELRREVESQSATRGSAREP